MSLWHIPVHKYFETDPFMDDIMEITFPPLRYFPLFNVGTKAVSKKKTPKENGFVVNLDVKHYKPEEVTLKVEGQVLEVSGKHRNENENGFESSEFHRKYTIPDDVDVTALTSNISQDGVLHIEAPKKLPATSGESTKETFKCTLDVQGFKPEEISIQVKGRDLVVHGETKTENSGEHGSSFHHKQFTKHVALPDDVDPSELSSRYTKDSKLAIEAPRKQLQAPLKLEIKMEE
ncbi:alpha-crystallin A chain-like [Hydra vulgaris]|uniref:alpha-crystallin A chain n=1 Tax=Hydra vulgaris TaxID=6087 RepID=UPI001F5E4544|nr:alpha-crystallin A chain-like [Hydra vulgaris]XP_047128252.1 alpha-crystallin A chain-like [Hydra vulgaris]XP_047128253.1 alpha-crystallin A chain-like [Hydra vulgaris]